MFEKNLDGLMGLLGDECAVDRIGCDSLMVLSWIGICVRPLMLLLERAVFM
jgi:hypothetical protein